MAGERHPQHTPHSTTSTELDTQPSFIETTTSSATGSRLLAPSDGTFVSIRSYACLVPPGSLIDPATTDDILLMTGMNYEKNGDFEYAANRDVLTASSLSAAFV